MSHTFGAWQPGEREFLADLRVLLPAMPLMRTMIERTGTFSWLNSERGEWCYWDLMAMVDAAVTLLPERQRQALLCATLDMTEPQMAAVMGLTGKKPPTKMYLTSALRRCWRLIHDGTLPAPTDMTRYTRREERAA